MVIDTRKVVVIAPVDTRVRVVTTLWIAPLVVIGTCGYRYKKVVVAAPVETRKTVVATLWTAPVIV